jgi:hypothetical protein
VLGAVLVAVIWAAFGRAEVAAKHEAAACRNAGRVVGVVTTVAVGGSA